MEGRYCSLTLPVCTSNWLCSSDESDTGFLFFLYYLFIFLYPFFYFILFLPVLGVTIIVARYGNTRGSAIDLIIIHDLFYVSAVLRGVFLVCARWPPVTV